MHLFQKTSFFREIDLNLPLPLDEFQNATINTAFVLSNSGSRKIALGSLHWVLLASCV
uniref:Uncharacterized protein n=1 Tax=Kalanchoe fedtschenkoi TaxID=63787 RepID=A0A7N0USB9_KALFE